MITITLMSTTRARITGKFDDKKLDTYFAFCKNKFWWRSPTARVSGWDGKTHLLQRGPGTLPIGLVRTAAKWLKKPGHEIQIVDERKTPKLAVRKEAPTVAGITLRDDQIDAVLRSIKAERGVIHGATGSGKTAVAAAIIKQFGFPCALFLTHRKKLARQTREAFDSYFGKTADAVGLIQGGKWEHGELPIYIAVLDTLASKKFEAERRWLNKAYEVLFLDEAHHAGSTTWYRVAQNVQARYRYGLTGTPVGRSDAGDLYLRACWVRLIMVPYHYLYPVILVFCGIGVFSLNNSDFDILPMALFGFLGYVFAKIECEPAPMLLGFILGPLMEEYLRRALIIGRGDWTVFLTNPISATMLVLAVVAMGFVMMPAIRKKRDEAFVVD